MTSHITTLSQVKADGRMDANFHVAAAPYRARCESLQQSMSPQEALAKLRSFPEGLLRRACAPLARSERTNVDTRQILAGAQAHPFLALAMLEAALPAYLQEMEAAEEVARRSRQELEAAGQDLRRRGSGPKR